MGSYAWLDDGVEALGAKTKLVPGQRAAGGRDVLGGESRDEPKCCRPIASFFIAAHKMFIWVSPGDRKWTQRQPIFLQKHTLGLKVGIMTSSCSKGVEVPRLAEGLAEISSHFQKWICFIDLIQKVKLMRHYFTQSERLSRKCQCCLFRVQAY